MTRRVPAAACRVKPHPDWLVAEGFPPGVGGLMTTRHGGISAPPFDTFNLQLAGGDADASVLGNRAVLAEAIGATPVFLRQVHGTRVVRLGPAHAAGGAPVEVADASVTTEPGIACTVLVADCLPVLFAGPGVVGSAHAGWRGLAGGVLEATVDVLCEAGGCRAADLCAWLGAAIGPARFQVGADVLAAFSGSQARSTEDSSPGIDGSSGFIPEQPGKWLADLPLLARRRLASLGVTRVAGGSWCTVSEASRFFSFRRERITGRMAAAVWIERRR